MDIRDVTRYTDTDTQSQGRLIGCVSSDVREFRPIKEFLFSDVIDIGINTIF